MIPVSIVDHASTQVDLVAIAHALEKQIQLHVGPVYGCFCTVGVGPSDVAWPIGLFTQPDQAGALGYHDLGPNGLPCAKVFPTLDAEDGANLSTTISHELIEMLVDPYLAGAVMASDGRFYAAEACDPCEHEEYEIDGVKVSDFVLPGWYSGKGKADYLGQCSPLSVTPGGYCQWYSPSAGWQMVEHAQQGRRSYRIRTSGRSARRRALRCG